MLSNTQSINGPKTNSVQWKIIHKAFRTQVMALEWGWGESVRNGIEGEQDEERGQRSAPLRRMQTEMDWFCVFLLSEKLSHALYHFPSIQLAKSLFSVS